jgi:hypothetical protein
MHEADCLVAWIVLAIGPNVVEVKRTKKSSRPGPDRATLSRSVISTMHRTQDCISTHRVQTRKKPKGNSKRKGPKVVAKTLTKPAKANRKPRGWRNPPKQA